MLIFLYIGSVLIANLLSYHYYSIYMNGIICFFLISFDLTVRDYFHITMRKRDMFFVILIAGLSSVLINYNSFYIALASTSAFLSAALVDYVLFAVSPGNFIVRSNVSNILSAIIDSLVFSVIAYGDMGGNIFFIMVAAKLVGGFVYSILLNSYIINRNIYAQ